MIYLILAFLAKHLWWQRRKLRQTLALILFFIVALAYLNRHERRVA